MESHEDCKSIREMIRVLMKEFADKANKYNLDYIMAVRYDDALSSESGTLIDYTADSAVCLGLAELTKHAVKRTLEPIDVFEDDEEAD